MLRRLAQDTIWSNLQSLAAGVYGGISINLCKEEWTMPDIGIRSKRITHLDNMYPLALHAKVNGTLAPRKTPAEHDNIVGDLILLQIIIVHDNHIVPIQSLDRWHQRLATNCNNECIRALCSNQLRRHLRIGSNLNAGASCEQGIGIRELVHLMLEG